MNPFRPRGTSGNKQSKGRGRGANDCPGLNLNDPIINTIHYGMDTVMKIATDTVPSCPYDSDMQTREITGEIESALLKMVKSELVHNQTYVILDQVVEELRLEEDDHKVDSSDFFKSLGKMELLTNQRIAEYEATLTPEILKLHPTFIRMKGDVDAKLVRDDVMEITDPTDAETETEEVDVDLEEAEGGAVVHEVIPELDPISKKPLRDPVRNRICRHIYGKKSIMELLEKNPRIRCPAMGCGNTRFVKAIDLIDDPILTMKVLEHALASSSISSKK